MSGSSGGSTTQVIQPTPPPAPSTAEAIQAYVQSLPALYEAQMKYAPMEAQQQVDLANQYAEPLAQAYQKAQNILYPGTSGLQEQLAAQAKAGINGNVPQGVQDQYRSDLTAQLGENAKSGIGADYVSRNLLNQQQQYQQYYQNLGLSLAGRQPLVNPTTPNYTNQLGNYTPGQGLNYTQGNYGVFAGGSRPIVSQNQQGTPNWITGLQAGGSVLQGAAQMFCWVAAEMFGGWNHPKTVAARHFISTSTPKWFQRLYTKHGEALSKNRIALIILRPLFEYFAWAGGRLIYGI